MKATILIDNLTKGSLIAEWGLAVWIEYKDQIYLLDTGASDKFARNAESMGLNLSKVSYGVLSHAHYDHADGLAAFFEKNEKADFYLRAGTKENCYGEKKLFFHRYIGIQRGYLKKYRDRIQFADGVCEIAPGVTLLPHSTPGLEAFGSKNELYVKAGRKYVPDSFEHEQSLVFDTEKGLVIFSSCSHGGADNIIKEVGKAFPGKHIYAMIGGFHLYHSTEEEVRALASRIKDTGIEKIYTGHCTGEPAFDILKQELGEQAEQLFTGTEILL